jgi:hypothetical protein
MAVCAICKGSGEWDECPNRACQEADWRIAMKFNKWGGGQPAKKGRNIDPHATKKRHVWPKDFDKDAKPPEIGAGKN